MSHLFDLVADDLRFYGGTSLRKKIMTLFFKRSFAIMFNYRLGSYCLGRNSSFFNLVVVYLKYRQLKYGSCHISYEATIGRRLNLPHPVGIVIGKGVVVRDDATIYQNCTIGRKDDTGYPVLQRGATLFAGCVVVGNITIGEGAVVGANVYASKSVPDRKVFHNRIA